MSEPQGQTVKVPPCGVIVALRWLFDNVSRRGKENEEELDREATSFS